MLIDNAVEEMVYEVSRNLTLIMSKDDDSGEYECRASNDATPGLDIMTFELVVQIPPDPPVIMERVVTVTQPEEAMFECTAMARPRPSITWYKLEIDGFQTILNGSEDEVSVTVRNGNTEREANSSLMISPSSPFFSAVYICEATNPVDTAETNATLVVNVTPEVTSVMNYTVNLYNQVTFQCVATGIPAPSITWFRNGTELTNIVNPRVILNDPSDPILLEEVMVYEVTRTLTLSRSENKDSGEYECWAINDASPGMDAQPFELIVQIPPNRPVITETMVTVTEPEEAMFECTSMARPRPSITWYRLEIDGSRTILNGSEDGVRITMENEDSERIAASTLMFSPSRPFFSAVYICETTNPVATAETSATLMVYVSPEVISVMNYTVNMGDPVKFQCVTTGIPAPAITWFRNETELNNAANSRITVSSHISTLIDDGDEGMVYEVMRTLTLSMSEDDDSGVYECWASNGATPGQDMLPFDLTVQIPPDPPVITEKIVTVTQPKEAVFECTAKARPRPSITWYRLEMNGSQTILNGSDNGVSITEEDGDNERIAVSILMFNPSRLFFSAVYICEATNPVATTDANATLMVYVTPDVTSVMNYTVNVTDSVTFQCVATGVPPPSITWLRNGTDLSSTINSRIMLNKPSDPIFLADVMLYKVTRTLTVSKSEDSDSGEYECKASSDTTGGMDEQPFELIVQIPPDPPVITKSVVTVTQPKVAMFECTAMARPRPFINWYRLEIDGSRTILNNSDDGLSITVKGGYTERIAISTLMFNPSHPFFSAVYICEATNTVATTEANATLEVYVNPEVTSVANYTVNMEDPVTFQCVATGIPAPSITWYKDGIVLRNTTSLHIILNNPSDPILLEDVMVYEVTRTLTLSISKDSDSGEYECRASNDATPGQDSEQFELIVQIPPDPPVITERVVTVTQPEKAMFECTAIARPRPSIIWYRVEMDGSRVILNGSEYEVSISVVEGSTERDTNSTLMISPSRPFFSAVYICEATNPVAIAETNASLKVYVTPEVTSVMNYTVNMGHPVTFQCVATGIPAPFITWFRNGTELNAAADSRITLSTHSSLLIDDGVEGMLYEVTRTLTLSMSEDGDSSGYECRASNDAIPGLDELPFELIVQIPPDPPVIADRTVTVTQPEAAMLRCTAMARPRPSITWYKLEMSGLRTILTTDSEDGVSITVEDGDTERIINSTLMFDPSRPFFSAVYICEATNPVATAEANATLNVYVTPEVTSVMNYTVIMGDSVTFQCVATGIPVPIITWQRNETELSNTVDHRITLNSPSSKLISDGSEGMVFEVTRTLILSMSEDGDSDAYQCRANNAATQGIDLKTFELLVQVPPEVADTTPSHQEIANVSDTAILEFYIDKAVPSVLISDIHWYYAASIPSGEPDFDSSVFEEITNLTNRTALSRLSYSSDLLTLSVSNIVQAGEETDAGRYYLRAVNPAGEDYSFIDLMVIGPPVIVGGPSDQFAINNGSSALFECNAIADPQHSVSWSFTDSTGQKFTKIAYSSSISSSSKYRIDRVESSPTFGALTITDVGFVDRGTYSCTAMNDLGEETAQANLTVHVIPVINSITLLNQTELNTTVAIFCLATGYPAPTITWQHNLANVSESNSRIEILVEDLNCDNTTRNGSIEHLLMMYPELNEEQILLLGELGVVGALRIAGVVRDDAGNYTCTARNQLPQTTLITVMSDPVPLVILEHPDPPTSIVSFNYGARWIAVRWTPTFDGNRPVLRFMLYMRNANMTENFVSEENLTASDLMTSGKSFMYNVSREDLVFPFTRYSFKVVSCNEIGCSDQSQVSPDVQTLQDTSSSPINVTITDTTTNTITLQWQPPIMPNGIISSYKISFSGVRSYNQSFSHVGEVSFAMSELEVELVGLERNTLLSGVATQLFSGTEYTLGVSAVNGAVRAGGVGMMSQLVTVITDSMILIQLRLVDVLDCEDWIVDNPVLKAKDAVQAVMTELRNRCQCDFEAELITNAGFRCFSQSPTAVTFRALVTGTSQTAAQDLAILLGDWVASGAFLTIQAQLLRADESCSITISSFGEKECNLQEDAPATSTGPSPENSSTVNVIVIVGAAAATAVLLLIIVVVTLVVLVRTHRRRKRRHAFREPSMPAQQYRSVVPLTQMARDTDNSELEGARVDDRISISTETSSENDEIGQTRSEVKSLLQKTQSTKRHKVEVNPHSAYLAEKTTAPTKLKLNLSEAKH